MKNGHTEVSLFFIHYSENGELIGLKDYYEMFKNVYDSEIFHPVCICHLQFLVC
jgi:hypothetical protein